MLLALLLLPVGARAEPVQASYSAYAAGLNVFDLDSAFDVAPGGYRVHLVYHTTGTFGLLVSSRMETQVSGRFAGGRAVPGRFVSSGTLRGQTRLTQIDYPGGQPAIRQLVPPNEEEREPVPGPLQVDTIDTVSAMAQLIERVNATGRCDGRAVTFDGRRLSELTARTAGEDLLPATGRSSFTGQALHCEFQGRQLAGFRTDEDRAAQQRVQNGSAWFAAVVPGGPKIPVRIAFHTRWFGDATMFLTARR
ncbi:MAG: hypothetical protein NVS2B11_13220 [Acetobacteraceae bacterium]